MKHVRLFGFALALLACDSGSEMTAEEQPALTREQLLDPAACKDCHPKHYEQWSASMHAYATDDPVFTAMNKRGQEETGGQLGDFCVRCHAPVALATGTVTDFANLDSVPKEQRGVTCYFCHNAMGVGTEHNNGNVQLANDDVMRAAIRNPIEPTAHKVAYSSFHDPTSENSSTLCGTCHDIMTPRGVHLERTFKEYKDSIFSDVSLVDTFASCQDCHMPRANSRFPVAESTGRPNEFALARDFHEHLWPAVDVALTEWPHAEAMRSAVEDCALPTAISAYFTVTRDPGPFGTIQVMMEADAGHMFPSGATQDRRVWLEAIAYDANMQEIWRVGQVGDQELEETPEQPHPCLFRDYAVDETGKETHDFWDVAEIARTNLMPFTPRGQAVVAGGHTAMCDSIRPPLEVAQIEPAVIDFRLRMRPMGVDVLTDLIGTGHLAPEFLARMPTFTVTQRRATLDPVAGQYKVVETGVRDCETYVCMIDPQSPDCTSR
jgi:nitrate/TMAO reductase-like tetraheme cytochrome c subunit